MLHALAKKDDGHDKIDMATAPVASGRMASDIKPPPPREKQSMERPAIICGTSSDVEVHGATY